MLGAETTGVGTQTTFGTRSSLLQKKKSTKYKQEAGVTTLLGENVGCKEPPQRGCSRRVDSDDPRLKELPWHAGVRGWATAHVHNLPPCRRHLRVVGPKDLALTLHWGDSGQVHAIPIP
jgi:hypothetical protein